MNCTCQVPQELTDPRAAGRCRVCRGFIDPDADWAVNDRTHNAFLDRAEGALREALQWPKDKPPPPEWRYFRYLCLTREQEGRERYGFAHLGRDNIQAGAEEATDGCNYTWFDMLQAIRHGDDVEMDLVLTAVYHDFMAYQTRLKLRGKRHGSP